MLRIICIVCSHEGERGRHSGVSVSSSVCAQRGFNGTQVILQGRYPYCCAQTQRCQCGARGSHLHRPPLKRPLPRDGDLTVTHVFPPTPQQNRARDWVREQRVTGMRGWLAAGEGYLERVRRLSRGEVGWRFGNGPIPNQFCTSWFWGIGPFGIWAYVPKTQIGFWVFLKNKFRWDNEGRARFPAPS